MTPNVLLSLQITALGMGLVFGAIILLSVMMSLLTRFTADKESASPKGTMSDSAEAGSVTLAAPPAPSGSGEHKAQAAAVAVAMALAEQKQGRPLYESQTALVSAWQLGMRTRQMYEKGGR